LLRCYFAIEDTVTPLIAELISLVFFVAAAPSLTHRFGISGLAAARTTTFWIVAVIYMFVLWKKQHVLRLDFQFFRLLLPTLAATGVMTLVSWSSLHLLQSWFDSGHTLVRLALLVIVLSISLGVFLGVARLFKLSQANQIVSTVRDLLPGAANRDRRE
jgi:peptidoglycan biosynthesis protein MviN/MurJ (putative lipid II flippase)